MLVAVDGSDTPMNAADYAITLAKNNNDAEIFVINVIDLSPIFKMLPSDTRKHLIRIGRQEANQILDTVAEMAKRHTYSPCSVLVVRQTINRNNQTLRKCFAGDGIVAYHGLS
jgi:hypothetical protein